MFPLRSLRATVALLAVAAFAAATPRAALAQMDSSAFKVTIKFAGWMMRLPNGTLMVGTRDSLKGLDPSTGQAVWARADLGGLVKESVDLQLNDAVLLNVPKKEGPTLRVIGVRDGKDRWSMPGLSLGHWVVPARQALLVWLWRPGDRMTEKEFGGRMMLVRLDDGKVLWEDPAFFAAPWPADRDDTGNLWRVQGPVFDSDSTMLTFMSPMGVRRWHTGTGQKLWATELKLSGAASPFFGYAPMLVDTAARRVLVPTGLGYAGVALADGAIGTRARTRGIPRQIAFVSGGLLMRTGSETVPRVRKHASTMAQRFLAAATEDKPVAIRGDNSIVLLDQATGEKKWKNEFRFGDPVSNFVVRDEKVYLWADNRLFALTLAPGEEQLLAKLPGFKDDDVPQEMVPTDAGLLLRGETNVMLVDWSGKLVHHTAFRRPGRSMFVRAAAAGLSAGASKVAGDPNDVMGALIRSGAAGVGDPDELRKKSTQTVHTGARSVMYAQVKRPGREDNGFIMFDALTGQPLGDVISAGLLNSSAFNDKRVDLAFDLDAGWMNYFEITNGTGVLGGWKLGAKR